jgi:hypothetical protein
MTRIVQNLPPRVRINITTPSKPGLKLLQRLEATLPVGSYDIEVSFVSKDTIIATERRSIEVCIIDEPTVPDAELPVTVPMGPKEARSGKAEP